MIYRDILKVPEYFQFDPTQDYLKPPLQGFRLVGGPVCPHQPIGGRLPSEALGLHLERDGRELRLFDPALGVRLLTPREQRDVERRGPTRRVVGPSRSETRAEEEARGRLLAEAEVARLRAEIEELRRKTGESG